MPRQDHFKYQIYGDETIVIDEAGLFCGGRLGYMIGFRFTDASLETLTQIVSSMSLQEQENRKTLLIDESFAEIAFVKIIELA